MRRFWRLKTACLCVLVYLPVSTWARCTFLYPAGLVDAHFSIRMQFGRFTMTHPYLQPVGSLLASTIVSPAIHKAGSGNGDTVVWQCDLEDLPGLHFLIATNGHAREGGFWESGNHDGLPGVYATWFSHVGLKLSANGKVLNRSWQTLPLKSYNTLKAKHPHGKDKINIRVKDLPVLVGELYRISQIPPVLGAPTNPYGMSVPTAIEAHYAAKAANAYVQLAGADIGLLHDTAGQDSATNRKFWAVNGYAYHMYAGSHMKNAASCVVRNATPYVVFPHISAQKLMDGQTVAKDFSAQIECHDSIQSGITHWQVALGLQVAPGSWQAAQTLKLVTPQTGVRYLVDEDYGSPHVAQGVGVRLRNGGKGQDRLFAGQPGQDAAVLHKHNSGWYPALDGATKLGSAASGYTTYTIPFTATLERLPGKTVTSGRFHARATVLIRVQ